MYAACRLASHKALIRQEMGESTKRMFISVLIIRISCSSPLVKSSTVLVEGTRQDWKVASVRSPTFYIAI